MSDSQYKAREVARILASEGSSGDFRYMGSLLDGTDAMTVYREYRAIIKEQRGGGPNEVLRVQGPQFPQRNPVQP